MKLLRIVTLAVSVIACNASVRGSEVGNSFADEIEVAEERALKGGSKAFNGQGFDKYAKGGKGGKKGSYNYGKGNGNNGGGGNFPAASPAFTPTFGCNSPTCTGGGTPSQPTCGSPTCSGGGGGASSPSFAGSSGKGKGFSGQKGGKSGKKGGPKARGKGSRPGKGSGGGGVNPPNPGNGTCGCAIDEVELDFVMLPPNATVSVAPNVPVTTIGSVFIYNDALFDLNLTALPGTFVAGICHRTQITTNLGTENTLVGGGYCHFTFTVSDGTTSVTFNAAGEVFDVLGGTLALTGGTGELTGTYGEVEIVPVYQQENQFDFFTEASLYVGSASLFVPLF